MSSFANATAGQSQTAWQCPNSWSHCSLPNLPSPSNLAAKASCHIRQSGGFSTLADIIWYVSVYPSSCRAERRACVWSAKEHCILSLQHSHAVPVLPSPSARTRMGTTRLHCLRSMSVSGVKISVTGLGVYGWLAMVLVSTVRYRMMKFQ